MIQYLMKNFPTSNGHLLDFGGVQTLARMVWGTYVVKIGVQLGILFGSGGGEPY